MTAPLTLLPGTVLVFLTHKSRSQSLVTSPAKQILPSLLQGRQTTVTFPWDLPLLDTVELQLSYVHLVGLLITLVCIGPKLTQVVIVESVPLDFLISASLK